MKKAGAVLLATLLAVPSWSLPTFAASSPSAGSIGGTVRDTTGHLIGGVEIAALSDGKVVANGLTDAKGEYMLGCLPAGQYSLTLSPIRTGLKGQTVVAKVGEAGLTVNWIGSTATPAVAALTNPGPSTCAAASGPLLTGKVAIGAALGIAALGGIVYGACEAADCFDGNGGGGVASPNR